MTMRQFNLVMFVVILAISLIDHDWLGATGWMAAAALQLDCVMNELEAKRTANRV